MPPATGHRPFGVAFLLAQVGSEVSRRFAERVGTLGLAPVPAACLRILATSGPMNQRQLAERLRAAPSRVVVIIDALVEQGLVERRRSETDRRSYVLVCTGKGVATYRDLRDLLLLHEQEFTEMLDDEQAATLVELLGRLARHRGLAPGVHPEVSGPPDVPTVAPGAGPEGIAADMSCRP